MDVTKPYEFIGFGAMDVTNSYKSIRFGAMDVTNPYEFTGFGQSTLKAPAGPKPAVDPARGTGGGRYSGGVGVSEAGAVTRAYYGPTTALIKPNRGL
jgi:hypothetical protein